MRGTVLDTRAAAVVAALLVAMPAAVPPLAAQRAVPAGATGAAAPRQERIEHRRPLARDGSLRIYNLMGEMRITGWDRDSVVVTGTITAGDRFFMGGGPQGVKLGIDNRAGETTNNPAMLEIRVPAGARVWVKSAGAPIHVAGVSGGVDLYTVGGDVHVSGRLRELSIETMDGDVEIAAEASWLRAKTASGGIAVRGGGEDIGLATVSGRILLAGSGFERAKLESVTGDVRVEGAPARGGTLAVDGHSGAIELRLPRDIAADFDLTTISGSIDNELTAARPTSGREMRGRELRFSAGGGGASSASISVNSFKGRILLRRQ